MNFNFFDLFWIYLLVTSLSPLWRQRRIAQQRLAMIRRLEQRRHSRVITLIHRQESIALLGIPVSRYIDVDDSEQILRAIKLTPPDMPIDLVLHTPGGLVLAAEQIAHALIRHKGPVTVFVPHYAMSGGTILALAADQIVMDENAVLGPVDPQVGNYAAADLVRVAEMKPIQETDDRTLLLAEMGRKALRQVHDLVVRITTANGMPLDKANELAEQLSTGRFTHDYPITYEEAVRMGMNVSTDMPEEIYRLMDLYPQPAARRPSVGYVPLPYDGSPTDRRPPSRDHRP
ncbi:MAG: ATP-dependent Clp protease proteolytic subunit [Limnochordaceae bacterium]|nr:ATP-dependent Clp protease proteolytic subunit [Limnochordaceae bacterium]